MALKTAAPDSMPINFRPAQSRVPIECRRIRRSCCRSRGRPYKVSTAFRDFWADAISADCVGTGSRDIVQAGVSGQGRSAALRRSFALSLFFRKQCAKKRRWCVVQQSWRYPRQPGNRPSFFPFARAFRTLTFTRSAIRLRSRLRDGAQDGEKLLPVGVLVSTPSSG